jgi:hypothetical protein
MPPPAGAPAANNGRRTSTCTSIKTPLVIGKSIQDPFKGQKQLRRHVSSAQVAPRDARPRSLYMGRPASPCGATSAELRRFPGIWRKISRCWPNISRSTPTSADVGAASVESRRLPGMLEENLQSFRQHLQIHANFRGCRRGIPGVTPTSRDAGRKSPEFAPASPDPRRLLRMPARLPWSYADFQGCWKKISRVCAGISRSTPTSADAGATSLESRRLPEMLARLLRSYLQHPGMLDL